MRAIHEIAQELTILNSISYKTSYLLLWRYPIKRISITSQQNGSADRTVIHYRLALQVCYPKTTTVLRTGVAKKKVWHQGDLSDTPAKIDYRMESNEGFDQYQEAPPGMEMPKLMMHLKRLLILKPMTDLSNK